MCQIELFCGTPCYCNMMIYNHNMSNIEIDNLIIGLPFTPEAILNWTKFKDGIVH